MESYHLLGKRGLAGGPQETSLGSDTAHRTPGGKGASIREQGREKAGRRVFSWWVLPFLEAAERLGGESGITKSH